MSSESTDYRTDQNDDQLTERTVTVDGDEHVFEIDEGAHVYQGDRNPPTEALIALEDCGAANPGDEPTTDQSSDNPKRTTAAPAYGGVN